MKVLVLQLKRIGDLVLTSPALATLRSRFPQAEITLAVADTCRELLQAMPYVDKALVFKRKGGNGNLWRELLFSNFDICLDFTGNDRSALFSVLSKARKRIAFEWVQKSGCKSLLYNELVRSNVRESHTVDHYLHLLRPLGIQAAEVPIRLQLPDWVQKKVGQLLAEGAVSSPFVLVHPGSARPEKYWLAERWAGVINGCADRGLPCVITGSSETAEQEHIGQIKAALGTQCLDLSGRLDLLSLAELTRLARVCCTVDSAAMHLAAGFATPQVALFGKTNPFHWRPRHSHAIVLAGGAQVREFAPKAKPAVMSDISTEQVLTAINSLL